MKTPNKIKKGCGKETECFMAFNEIGNDVYFKCGDFNLEVGEIVLCPTCQALLELLEQAQEFQKKIIEVIKGIAFYNEESEEMVLNKINKIFSEEGEGKE